MDCNSSRSISIFNINPKSQTYDHVAQLFSESEFQHQGNKQTKKKNANSQQNLAVFSATTDSANMIIQILHEKVEIKKNGHKCHC